MIIDVWCKCNDNECDDGYWSREKVKLKENKKDSIVYAIFEDASKFMSVELHMFHPIQISKEEMKLFGKFIFPLYLTSQWHDESQIEIKKLKKQINALKKNKK